MKLPKPIIHEALMEDNMFFPVDKDDNSSVQCDKSQKVGRNLNPVTICLAGVSA